MEPLELTFGIGLAGLLVAVAVYFGSCQRQTLQQLRHDTDMSVDDRRYLYKQVVRRLFSSALMLVLAGFLVGSYFLDMEPPTPFKHFDHGDHGHHDLAPEEIPEFAKQSLRFFVFYWIATLLVFLVVVVLAIYDMLATARFGARHRRQLADDRRTALMDEVERLQRDRHRLNGGL